MIVNLIGYFAMFLSVIIDAPQIIKIYKIKSSNDISLIYLFLRIVMMICWFIYGVAINNFLIAIANILCIFMAFLLVIFYFKYKKL